MFVETTFLSQLDTLRYLVIDEADRMLEPGHFEDLTKLLSLINSKDNPTVSCLIPSLGDVGFFTRVANPKLLF